MCNKYTRCTILLVESMKYTIPHPVTNIAYKHNFLNNQGVSNQTSYIVPCMNEKLRWFKILLSVDVVDMVTVLYSHNFYTDHLIFYRVASAFGEFYSHDK